MKRIILALLMFTLTMRVTAYSLTTPTFTGHKTQAGVIAAPAWIPLYSIIYVPGYGEGIVLDRGKAITGYSLDVWLPTYRQAIIFGRQTLEVTVKRWGNGRGNRGE